MEPLLIALVLGAVVAAAAAFSRRATQAKQAEAMRQVNKVTDEDVTRFGEELTTLDTATELTAHPLDQAARQDYQRALDAYENAKSLLADARQPEDVTQVTKTLEDGRYALACVQARVAGEPLPQRRPPCFFNPAHGPGQTEAMWAPSSGEEREIPVCLADADRLSRGAEPDTRQVRRGNRMVPWYQGGPAFSPYAGGYYGGWAMNGMFPGFILGAMISGDGWGDDQSGCDQSGGGAEGTDFGGGGEGAGDSGGSFGDFGGGF
jgi:hypothetical protein